MNKNKGFLEKLNNLFPTTTVIEEAKMTVKKRSIIKITLIFFLVFFIGSMLSSFILGIPTTAYLMFNSEIKEATQNASLDQAGINQIVTDVLNDLPSWMLSFELIGTIGAIIACIGYCTKFERRRLFTLGFVRKGAVKESLLGVAAGLVMFATVFGIMLLSGQVTFNGFNSEVSYLAVAMFFIGYIIQAYSEELMFRGYLMVSGATTGNILLASLGSSVVFASLHLANYGISVLAFINILLFGLFTCIYFLRRGSIWGVAALHAMWNFAQGSILGCQVSGNTLGTSLFTTTNVEGTTLFNGGSFGPEGGLAVTIVLVIGIIILSFMKNKDVYPEIDFSKEFYSAF